MERGVITEIPLHVLRILSRPSLIEGVFYFSQNNTDEQNTQGSVKIVAPPPVPSPKGRGVITEIPL